ncbi:MAG: hypothetical protein JW722_07645 [Demequinaceae bacterium]|nr:hypothetical protein [Demequinaceae bacterium]
MTRGLIAGALAILIFGGCSTSETAPSNVVDAAFREQVADAIRGAETANASEEQIATLEEIARTGKVTFEQYREGHMAGFACMESAGLTVSEPYTYTVAGSDVFTADVTQPADMSEEAFLAILDSCDLKHSLFVDNLYYTQPSAVSAWADLIESHRAEILACFTSQGAEFDEDITWMEMETIREEIVIAQRERDRTIPPVDCFDVAGIIWPED